MAKKQKIIINRQELTPTVIGELNKNTTDLLFLMLVFVLLVLFVWFLPLIVEEVDVLLGNNVVDQPIISDSSVGKNSFVQGMTLTSDLVILSNITLDGNKLSFVIVNSSSESVSLDKSNYYLEVYDSRENLINRIDFENLVFSPNSTNNFSTTLSKTDVNTVDILKITTDMYPSVELNVDENSKQNLVCIKDDVILTYYFQNNLLTTYSQKVILNDNNYSDYSKYIDDYNEISGVAAVIVDDDINSEFRMTVNYSLYKDDILPEFYMNYIFSTNAKVINFDLVTKGFDCN